MGMKAISKPPIKHTACGEVVETSMLTNLQSGHNIGCICHCTSAEANKWANRRDEVVEMGKKGGFVVITTPEEWKRDCSGRFCCPKFKCLECDETVTTTQLNSLQKGQNIGCRCHNTNAEENKWANRRDEIVEMGKKGGFVVITAPEEWKRDCTGCFYCPTFKCMDCDETVTTTQLSSLKQGHNIGCRCHNSRAEENKWANRRDEIVEMGKKGGFVVITAPEEWKRDCTGIHYCPKFKCLECDETVTTTRLKSLQRGQCIGCGCRNKTEAKVADWLRNRLPEAVITCQFPGPGKTRFDFHLRFPDGFEVIVEVDGAQHFWDDKRFFDLECCKRDLKKEEWSVDAQRNTSIIRLLQEDAWNDRNGWETFLMRSIDAARKAKRARVFHPDAPEYTSENSAYVQLRE